MIKIEIQIKILIFNQRKNFNKGKIFFTSVENTTKKIFEITNDNLNKNNNGNNNNDNNNNNNKRNNNNYQNYQNEQRNGNIGFYYQDDDEADLEDNNYFREFIN